MADDKAGWRAANRGVVRTYDEERRMISRETPSRFRVEQGFVEGMNVPGKFYVNKHLEELMFGELRQFCSRTSGDVGGFLPAVKQLANVAALPGIVKYSIALPDVHAGYGFAIGNVAAFDMANPEAVVSPGGVGLL